MTAKKNYTKIRLFIASPGDVTPERDRLLKIVQEFNQPNGFLDDLGVTLQPLDWRSHVAPLMGRPEAVVLEQLRVETWDIFVGIMWSRFGTATGGVDPQTGFSFDSGTEEEFTLAYQAWQKNQRPEILFYRCMRPIPPRNLNIDQYQRLEAFFKDFSPDGKHPGFVQEFKTNIDFADRVRKDLESILANKLNRLGMYLPNKPGDSDRPIKRPIEETKVLLGVTKFLERPCDGTSIEDLDDAKVLEVCSKMIHADSSIGIKTLLMMSNLLSQFDGITPTKTCILCFCPEASNWMAQATVIWQKSSGLVDLISSSVSDSRGEISGSLFRQIDELLLLFEKNLHPTTIRTGEGKRKDDLEIPKLALREIIVNALIHREYNTQTHVVVKITDEFIEIRNPGEFPNTFDLENVWDHSESEPRDAVLSRIAYHAGYAEKSGSGLQIVRRTFEERDLKLPEIISKDGKTTIKIERPSSKIERPSSAAFSRITFQDTTARYLNAVLASHQYLPVAGFETNLRIPIPLDKVYVTVKARMAELEHARGALDSPARKRGSAQPDQTVNVQQALQFALQRDYDGLVLLGYPGAGKTTLTKYFLLCFAGNKAEQQLGLPQQLLPILLSLRDVDPEQPLTANILASLQKYHLDLSDDFFLHYLQEGRAILLLDGLDEVPTEKKRALVSAWIHHQAHLAFPKCPVLVTSRFSGYRGEAILPGYYLRLEIQDYGMPEVQQFLENWLIGVETHVNEDNDYWRNQAKSKAENLFQRLEAAPALRELAVNPLMLQIIALVHRDRGTLPERRVELYKECTDVLLERWDKAKGLEVLLSATLARQLLQSIALWMHSVENRREVSKTELLAFMQPHLGRIKREVEPEELLRNWQERSGIFKGEGEVYFFHHLSFQEYLTAEEIRNTRQADILVKQFDQAWWREPTLLAMGLTNPPIFADFMRALLRANWRDGARVDFLLRCVDETLVKDEAPFVHALKKLKRFEPRYYALLALERIGTDTAKAAVAQAQHDKDTRLAGEARGIFKRMAIDQIQIEMPEVKLVKSVFKGKTYDLPARIYNALELNAEYILIPGGTYKYSVTKKEVEVPPLYFAKYPVTNKLYNRFIAYLSGKSKEEVLTRLPFEQFVTSLLKKAKEVEGFKKYLNYDPKKWASILQPKMSGKNCSGHDQPALRVTWFDAVAYCHWLNELQKINNEQENVIYRLPVEQEWEWAASGGKRKYPWGNEEWNESRANCGGKVGQTTPVGAYPSGVTPEGLMDMAGNVFEWMENRYAITADVRALRGGSWNVAVDFLLCAARNYERVEVLWNDDGFRVVCAANFDDFLKP